MLSALVSRLPNPVRRQIEHRVTLLRAAENTGWIIANNIVRLVLSMVVGIWVARYLGVAQYGLFNYVVSLTVLLRNVIPLGTTNLTMRDLARSREERNQILGSVFFVQVMVSVVTLLVTICIAFFAQQDDSISRELTLIISVTLLMVPFEIIGPWFQSQLQAVKVLIANTTSLLLMALARIWLVQIEASLQAFIYLLVAEKIVNVLTLLYLYHKSGESIRRWNFNAERAWHIVREGIPLFWSVMARSVYSRGNEVMLKSLATPTAVGYYAAATRIADLYMMVPSAIVSSSMPIIAQSKTQDRMLYLTQLTSLFRITGAIGIGSTIVVGFIAHWIMPLIYGEEFAGASTVLAINIWSAIPASFDLITGIWIINEGLASVFLQKVLSMAGLVTILNWFLIPLYGASGAAMSILIASTIVYIIWDFVDPRMRNFGLLKLHALLPWWFSLKGL